MVVTAAMRSNPQALELSSRSNQGKASFSDVPAGSSFYTYIETAYANQILSGYTDGTFHPNLPATRGEMARIIMLASTPQKALHPDGVLNSK
jgi:hypothetical protein